ncbi:hypothetical protein Holit_01099 [Hollandina sp. SP2]
MQHEYPQHCHKGRSDDQSKLDNELYASRSDADGDYCQNAVRGKFNDKVDHLQHQGIGCFQKPFKPRAQLRFFLFNRQMCKADQRGGKYKG